MLDVQGLQSFVNSFEKEVEQDDVKQLNGSNILTYRTKINIILEQEALIDEMSMKFEKLSHLQSYQHFKFLQDLVAAASSSSSSSSSSSNANKIPTQSSISQSSNENTVINASAIQQLKPIEISHLIQKKETAALVARVQGMLARYNEIVKIVSQKFLYYDQLMARYEQLVDKELMKQREYSLVTSLSKSKK